GGVIPAIEGGFIAREIQEAAYRAQRAVESKEQIVVGVNRYRAEGEKPPPIHRVDPALEKEQVRRLARFKTRRDSDSVARALSEVERRAGGTDNLLPAILAAIESAATLGETSGARRRVFGVHRPQAVFGCPPRPHFSRWRTCESSSTGRESRLRRWTESPSPSERARPWGWWGSRAAEKA